MFEFEKKVLINYLKKISSYISISCEVLKLLMISLLYFTDVSGGPAPAPAPAPAQSDDFDMFAQSRKSFDQNKENMRCVTEFPVLLGFIL